MESTKDVVELEEKDNSDCGLDSASQASDGASFTSQAHPSLNNSVSARSSIGSEESFSTSASSTAQSETGSVGSVDCDASPEAETDTYGIPLERSCIGSEERCYTYSRLIVPPSGDDGPLNIRVGRSEIHGLGMFVTEKIPKGRVVFSEGAAIVVNSPRPLFDAEELHASLSQMNEFGSISYLTLYPPSASDDTDLLSERFKVNAFLVHRFPRTETRALFFGASRLNHSHEPNMAVEWGWPRRLITFRALEDIEPGTELTIAYCCVQSSDECTMDLENGAFLCACDRCSGFVDHGEKATPDGKNGVCDCSFCNRGNEGFLFIEG
ncbi:SET domain-containing protein 5 [Phlyctema vagabunda]|uniref:SET domain-containing protein 5 n=1 Tax=Phlyctema vagabunda TaxID=108571 RepID=A0ABR4PUS5_9HELO